MTIYNFGLLNIPFANGAPSNEIAPFPDYDRGLGIAFEQSDGKPEMKGLNGLFNIITSSLLYLRQRGIGEWSADYEYPIGSFVTSGAALYKAKTLNTNKNPATSQTDWQLWASVSDITVSTNGNLKKTNNANGSIHLEVPTADTSQRGAMRFATATEVANRSAVSAAITPNQIPLTDKLTTATGSAPSYSARAIAAFAGSGGVTMQTSLNISSVVRNSAGDYTINFATAMPNANYAVLLSGCRNVSPTAIDGNRAYYNRTTTSVRIKTMNTEDMKVDHDWISVVVFC